MKIILACLLICFSFTSFGQIKKHKQKNSTGAGTLFFYWGYNRSYYTNSTIRFVGPDYDFKMKGVAASDRPDRFDPSVYFNPATLTVPQYNMRIGYYFRDKWAISFGVDHFKYVMNDRNDVTLNGFIGLSADSSMAGTYSNDRFITDRDKFHYENTNGCNFLRFELTRSFDIFELGDKRQLALTANLGVSLGPALTFNDLNFGGKHTFATVSLSGYAGALNGGLRLEFFRHFFMQMNSGLGFFHLTHVRTRPDDRNSFARQAFGYSEYNAAAGVLLYLRGKNGCDSCPHW